MLTLLALLMGCSGEDRPVAIESGTTIHLASEAHAPSVIEIPDSSRPNGLPSEIVVSGPWQYAGQSSAGLHKFKTMVPFRPRGLFFHRAQPGMVLKDAKGKTLNYGFGKRGGAWMWSHDRNHLTIYMNEKEEPTESLTLTYDRAIERDRALQLESSESTEKASFVRKTIQDDWDSRMGILVPAPGKVSWELKIPEAGEFSFVPGLVEPEVRDGASDGAKLVVELTDGTGTTEIHSEIVAIREWKPRRVSLAKWAGETVTLTLRSETMGSADHDYVFVAEPVVSTRKANPRKVVMVFIDTLRPDHLGLYGYERDTTEAINHLADSSVIFENARSIAPWTLPSARTVLTGKQPEAYDNTATIAARLKEEGWASAFMSGNVYLSANFDMNRDWDFHRVGLWPEAEEVTDDALEWLATHEGDDALLQVHYMDPHLPYQEPSSYRDLFAGAATGGLKEEFHLSDVRRAGVSPDDTKTIDYIKGRYDNNIRYATDQIQRLIETLDDNDILVIYSDHGEEFWDHKGFEHGHTLFEELLHVPLIIKAPGLTPGRVTERVSLLDITPTILDLLDIETNDKLDGVSLVKAASGDSAAKKLLAERDHAYGRPLYGMERWGVLTSDSMKYWASEGREALYDLSKDPGETKSLALKPTAELGEPYREAFREVMGTPLRPGYRMVVTRNRGGQSSELTFRCTFPGGLPAEAKYAYRLGNSYLNHATPTITHTGPGDQTSEDPFVKDGEIRVEFERGMGASFEIFVFPTNANLAEVTGDTKCFATSNGETKELTISERRDPSLNSPRTPLTRVRFGDKRQAVLTFGIAPIDPGAMDTKGDGDNAAMLAAMGYVETDEIAATVQADGWTKATLVCGDASETKPITKGTEVVFAEIDEDACKLTLQGASKHTLDVPANSNVNCKAKGDGLACTTKPREQSEAEK